MRTGQVFRSPNVRTGTLFTTRADPNGPLVQSPLRPTKDPMARPADRTRRRRATATRPARAARSSTWRPASSPTTASRARAWTRSPTRTRTTKRMIYYYFGGKEQLYVAVLERAYARIRAAEREVDVDHLDPLAAIRRLAELTFDHHESHPDFIRLVSIENIHHAEHMAQSERLANLNNPAIDADRADPRARARRGGLPARRRPGRPAHDDQRVLRLPRRQPPHVRRAVRPRSDRPGAGASTTARCSATWSSTTSAARPPDRSHRGQWVGTRRTEVISSSRTSTR